MSDDILTGPVIGYTRASAPAPTDRDLAPYGWEPGGYTILCRCCGRQVGNVGPFASKRSRTCRPCAERAWKADRR